MAGKAEMFGIEDPPAVTPVRVVSREEEPQVRKECLAEQGFFVEATADGLHVQLAPGQGDAYFLADYICSGRYPVHEVYTTRLTPEQLAVHYAWTTESVVPCMRGLGFEVPTPPTWESYLEGYTTKERLWYPFDDVLDEQWVETVRTVAASCQLEPDDADVYGTPPADPAG
jgi:hypothetical protein